MYLNVLEDLFVRIIAWSALETERNVQLFKGKKSFSKDFTPASLNEIHVQFEVRNYVFL